MTPRDQRRELSKLRILQHLSEPDKRETGTIGSRLPSPERAIESDRLVATMLEEGLLERRPHPTHQTAKPYFITQQGSEYLELAKQKAVFPDLGPRKRWTAPAVESSLSQAVSDVLRELPEFRDSDDNRIREVTERIASAVSQATNRRR